MMLRSLGFETDVAGDGIDALRRAAAFKPDLLLLDISMPKLDGYDTCGVIRAQPWAQGVRLVAVTGHDPEGLRERSEKAGFDAWLLKPVDFDDLRGVTYYNGQVYFVDANMQVLRRFDPASNLVTTLAGQPYVAAHGDGYGAQATFQSPRYMASDNSGMLYISDNLGCAIRSYNIHTGYVGTFAGQGPGPCSYADGNGVAAGIDRPRGMTSDGASLYWVEVDQHTIRQGVLVPTPTSPNGEVTTLAGQFGCSGTNDGVGATFTGCGAAATFPRFTAPFDLVYHHPSRSLYVYSNQAIRRIE